MVDACMSRGVLRASVCGQPEIEQLSRDGSHYSLPTGILPSLGARNNRRVKLRSFIISPYDRRYRTMLVRIMPLRCCLFLLPILFILQFFNSCQGDIGTAAQYSPPYLPTICYGNDASEFPSSNLFAAAGDGIWDNGASCGRQYLVRCISATQPGTCVPGQTIQIKIVDYAPSSPSTPSVGGTAFVLSETAFGIIANSTAAAINIEFQQV